MASVELYNPQEPQSPQALSTLQLLQLTRPSCKCRFVRQGDTFHLLVFINEDSNVPILRVPVESIYYAMKGFQANEQSTPNR
ncbi:hypothetical protein ACFFUP_16035 [Vibrio ostreicida]|uniref:Uncharacterized protein n=1 Tax=Vibrio ostreicida TaxID=526588 RepID=A0ABT8C024_9VIBR|nr:hypothetical protein [Vibrio ostreicida]MDN3610038.1 hypothetical protein [Vibrio ostreicida]MDN3611638.1 hypothetical protein [Vibrio ostreicida]MDN3611645.1 hypothetical protein [Vibrio ostreicida]NPD10997.1 hypothetical protein [Vibrio ostreicida]